MPEARISADEIIEVHALVCRIGEGFVSAPPETVLLAPISAPRSGPDPARIVLPVVNGGSGTVHLQESPEVRSRNGVSAPMEEDR